MVTDGWPSDSDIFKLGYLRKPHCQKAATTRDKNVGTLLPCIYRVTSLSKQWFLGTARAVRSDTPAELPEQILRRVELPPVDEPRSRLLVNARTLSRSRPSAFPATLCKPKTEEGVTNPSKRAGPPAEPGPCLPSDRT